MAPPWKAETYPWQASEKTIMRTRSGNLPWSRSSSRRLAVAFAIPCPFCALLSPKGPIPPLFKPISRCLRAEIEKEKNSNIERVWNSQAVFVQGSHIVRALDQQPVLGNMFLNLWCHYPISIPHGLLRYMCVCVVKVRVVMSNPIGTETSTICLISPFMIPCHSSAFNSAILTLITKF